MRKRPIPRRRLTSFPRYSCLCRQRADRPNPGVEKSFFNGGRLLFAQAMCVFNLLLLSASLESFAGQDEASPAPVSRLEETNSSPELLQAILELQGQLCSEQLAIEENQREARAAANRNAEALSNGLQKIESVFSQQQESFAARSVAEVEAIKSSNRTVLIVAGAFALIAFLATVITAFFQWHTGKLWAEILPMARGLGRNSTVTSLATGDYSLAPSTPVEDTNLRLLGAMEQLERRIQGLERSSKHALRAHDPAHVSGDHDDSLAASKSDSASTSLAQSPSDGEARISALLRQGQSWLKENDLEAALGCFEEALSLNPNHSEALVKKGATLERLKRLNEAFECYDRAIAADNSMTNAYLHKGGLCNRLERFKEALECYEKALRTQDE